MNELNRESLIELLRKLDSHFYYYPNPGNAGDSLIACATLQFFENANLSYEIVLNNDFDSTGKTVLYGGGGNFGGGNSRVGMFIQKYYKTAKNIVILPHTIFSADELLQKLPNNCHIICRERVSYDYVSSMVKDALVYLHDDMVLQCDIQQLLKRPKNVCFLPYILKELKYKLLGENDFDFGLSLQGYLTYKKYLANKKTVTSPKILEAFRGDVEKTSHELPENNIDLSAVLELSACEPSLAKLSCYELLKEINKYDEVRTNRLHIAIGAARLGKQVKLYANNYYKIRAIYEYSLEGKFDKVEWMVESSI